MKRTPARRPVVRRCPPPRSGSRSRLAAALTFALSVAPGLAATAMAQEPEQPFNVRLPPFVLSPDHVVTAAEATKAGIRSDETVLGVTIGKESRAYPIAFVATHEVVNDRLDGVAIAITW